MKRTITIILITIVLIFCNVTIAYADDDSPNSEIWKTAKNWIERGKDHQSITPDTKTTWESFNDLAGLVWGIGVCVVLIAGTILGIKYMFASVEGKAEIKQGLQPFVIGTIVILGALTIWKFAVQIFESIV